MGFVVLLLSIGFCILLIRNDALEVQLHKTKIHKFKKDYSKYTQDIDFQDEFSKYEFTDNYLYLEEDQIREILLNACKYSIGKPDLLLKYSAIMKIIPSIEEEQLFEIRIINNKRED
jgi:hypothetical protein